MGNLNDYFRAADDLVAAETGRRLAGPLVAGESGEPALDGIDAKGIDATVILGKLIAIAGRVEWSVDLVANALIYPRVDDTDSGDGPWVTRLGDEARNTLANIDEGRSADLAREWALIDEFWGRGDPDALGQLIPEFIGLARRARSAGEHLYSWSSL